MTIWAVRHGDEVYVRSVNGPTAARPEALDRRDPGTSKLQRLEENLAVADIELTPDDRREIEDAQIEATCGALLRKHNQPMIDR